MPTNRDLREGDAVRSTRVGVIQLQLHLPLLIALLCTGCAVFASKAELRLVERMQRETDPVIRADSLVEYNQQFGGEGRLQPRVVAIRDEVDDAYWDYLSGQGLEEQHVEDYLGRFPSGSHAGEATRRRDQLRYFAEADAARREAQRQAEEDERRRVEEENERQRALVRAGLERWLRTALSLPRWGTTVDALAALDEGFAEQWSGEPAAVCVASTCRKTFDAFYFFAVEGSTRLDRSISLVLQVDTRDGRVFQITGYYTGRGFVDWLEMGSEQPIPEETLEDREMARDAMMAMVQGAVDTLIPGAAEEESEEEGLLLQFRREQLLVRLIEFPSSSPAGRVDGFQVTFTGDLAAPVAPTPEGEAAPPAPATEAEEETE